MSKSTRQRMRERQQEAQQKSRVWTIIFIAIGVLVVGGIVALVVLGNGNQPRAGEAVAIPADAQSHVTSPGEVVSRTDPPTGGPHYGDSASPGFYSEPVEDGLLMHSLEHGYVIIWYDCTQFDDCGPTMDSIESIVSGGPKLIGMPRSGMESPIALTSWDRIERLDYVDENAIRRFIRDNLNRSPEPNAQ